jgi:hypothetical protein
MSDKVCRRTTRRRRCWPSPYRERVDRCATRNWSVAAARIAAGESFVQQHVGSLERHPLLRAPACRRTTISPSRRLYQGTLRISVLVLDRLGIWVCDLILGG